MKRFAQTVNLKDDPEVIRLYEEYHANVWPEVVAGTQKCGVQRIFIYRFGRTLFMFMETVDSFDRSVTCRSTWKIHEHENGRAHVYLSRASARSTLRLHLGSNEGDLYAGFPCGRRKLIGHIS